MTVASAYDVATIAPDVSGLVTEVDVVDNMPVHKGQPLFVIDRPRYEFALQQAEAALQQATAGLQQAEAGVQVQTTLLDAGAPGGRSQS